MDMPSDFERIFFFEQTRKTAEAIYAKNPLDADNLTNWGGALLELASFQPPAEAKKMMQESISKLEEALEVNPSKSDTMWHLGNALTSLGFMVPDFEEAGSYFTRAGEYYKKASDEEPGNELYRKSLEIVAKAPELHVEFHKHGMQAIGQQAEPAATGPSSSSSNKKATKKKEGNSDFIYDIMGWVILTVGVVSWLGFAKNNAPSPQLM